jgi:alpha-galactosidase
MIRCYSEGNPDIYADCHITVAKAERNDSIAKTPPMGYNSWNSYGRAVCGGLIKDTLDIMLKPLHCAGGKSLRELGYNYFQVDGGWRRNWLEPDGSLLPNERFGGVAGLKKLIVYAHANGMKFGLHICPGWGDCAGQPMGTFADGFTLNGVAPHQSVIVKVTSV